MKRLKQSQTAKLKQSLTEEKRLLEQHFKINGIPGDTQAADAGGELSAYDNHPADMATETFERERDQAIDESFGEKLEQVNAALQRMESGTYGNCEVCDNLIPYERLEALPWTTFCVDHAGMSVNGRERPETEAAATYEIPAPVLLDEADTWKTLEEYGSSDSPVPSPREG